MKNSRGNLKIPARNFHITNRHPDTTFHNDARKHQKHGVNLVILLALVEFLIVMPIHKVRSGFSLEKKNPNSANAIEVCHLGSGMSKRQG